MPDIQCLCFEFFFATIILWEKPIVLILGTTLFPIQQCFLVVDTPGIR